MDSVPYFFVTVWSYEKQYEYVNVFHTSLLFSLHTVLVPANASATRPPPLSLYSWVFVGHTLWVMGMAVAVAAAGVQCCGECCLQFHWLKSCIFKTCNMYLSWRYIHFTIGHKSS